MTDQPLTVEIHEGELRIRIGIDRLAFCTHLADWNNPYDEEAGDFKRLWRVKNQEAFAEAIKRELTDEGEDGSTPLTRLIDQAGEAAVEDGCEGVDEWTGEIDW